MSATPDIVRAAALEVKDHSPRDFQITRRSDDAFITRFINVAKGDADKAVSRLVSLEKWEVKHVVDQCESITAISQKKFFQQDMFKYATASGEALVSRDGLPVMYMDYGKIDFELVPPADGPVGMYYSLEKWMRARSQLHEEGSLWIADAAELGWSQFNLELEKAVTELIGNMIPIRMTGMYMMREPFVFKMMYALVRPFLSTKLASRIHVCGSDFAQLHEMVSPDQLPDVMEGTGELESPASLAHRFLMEEVERVEVTIDAEAEGAKWEVEPMFNGAILCSTGAGPFYKDDVILELNGELVEHDTVPALPSGTKVVVGRIMQDILGRPVKHVY